MNQSHRFVEIPGGRTKHIRGRRGGSGPSVKDGDIVPWGPEKGSKRKYHRAYRNRIKRQLLNAHRDGFEPLTAIRELSSHKWFGCYMS